MRMEKIQELMNELNAEIDKLSEDCVEVTADVGEGWEECGREDAEEFACKTKSAEWAGSERWQGMSKMVVPELDFRFRSRKDVPRNSDGDSIEDMQAVQDRLGKGSIEIGLSAGWSGVIHFVFKGNVNQYRIAAKHSDVFNPDTMDWDTWREAMSKKDVVFVHESNGEVVRFGSDGLILDGSGLTINYTREDCTPECNWSVIPRAQYEQETKPKEPEQKPARYVTDEHNGVKSVYDRNGKYTLCICHQHQDCYRIAKAMNEMQKRKDTAQ